MNSNTLETLLGSTVIAVYGLIYHRSGVPKPEPAAIWIRCDGDMGVRFFGGADGMHLICDLVFPWPFDMQNDGSYLLADLTQMPPWSLLLGMRIAGLDAIVSRESGGTIGVGLRSHEADHVLYILNLGDELRPFAALPEEIISEENAAIVQIKPCQQNLDEPYAPNCARPS